MDWDDLRIFLAVARSESLSGAGKLLRIDPATVGRRIARLESALSARLFTKTPQGYALTEDGQRLMDPARQRRGRLCRRNRQPARGQRGIDRPNPYRCTRWRRKLPAAPSAGANQRR